MKNNRIRTIKSRKNRLEFLVGIGVSLLVLLAYIAGLSPTIQSGDNPDVITAAATLGIPHSPGYPLYTMLGFLFSKIPLGTIAWRINLMSALFSVATIFIVYLIIYKICRNIVAAIAGGLILAFSFNYFNQSLFADYLTLNNLLVSIEILLLLTWKETSKPKYLYLWALFAGLAASHHQISLLVLPAFIYFVIVTDKKISHNWQILKLLGFFILGLVPFIYLPIRAATHPVYIWGNPSTWSGFWQMIFRLDYSQNGFAYLGYFPLRIINWLKTISWYQFFWLGFLLGIIGFFVLRKKYQALYKFFLLLILLSGFFFAALSNTPTTSATDLMAMQRFYIFSLTIFAIAIGVGINSILPRLKKLSLLVIILPLILFTFHFPKVNHRQTYYAYDYGKNILQSLPPDSVIYVGFDLPLFELWYLQTVEHFRTDVIVLAGADSRLIRLAPWLSEQQRQKFPDYELPIEEQAKKYPLYTVNKSQNFWGGQTKLMIPEGIVYRFSPEENWLEKFDGKRAQDNFLQYTLEGEYDATKINNESAKEIISHYTDGLVDLGIAFQRKGLTDLAAISYEQALKFDPNNIMALTNLASTYLDKGQYLEAKIRYKKILEKYPDSKIARTGLDMAEKYMNEE